MIILCLIKIFFSKLYNKMTQDTNPFKIFMEGGKKKRRSSKSKKHRKTKRKSHKKSTKKSRSRH